MSSTHQKASLPVILAKSVPFEFLMSIAESVGSDLDLSTGQAWSPFERVHVGFQATRADSTVQGDGEAERLPAATIFAEILINGDLRFKVRQPRPQ
jgi:hypothetical protein